MGRLVTIKVESACDFAFPTFPQFQVSLAKRVVGPKFSVDMSDQLFELVAIAHAVSNSRASETIKGCHTIETRDTGISSKIDSFNEIRSAERGYALTQLSSL